MKTNVWTCVAEYCLLFVYPIVLARLFAPVRNHAGKFNVMDVTQALFHACACCRSWFQATLYAVTCANRISSQISHSSLLPICRYYSNDAPSAATPLRAENIFKALSLLPEHLVSAYLSTFGIVQQYLSSIVRCFFHSLAVCFQYAPGASSMYLAKSMHSAIESVPQ